MGQGYHFSRPLSERDMDNLLAKNPRYL